jgi:membrane-associated phospholipid phosphatase
LDLGRSTRQRRGRYLVAWLSVWLNCWAPGSGGEVAPATTGPLIGCGPDRVGDDVGMTPSHRVGPGAVALLLWSAFAAVAVQVELASTGDRRALMELHDLVGYTAQEALAAIDNLTVLLSLAIVAVVATLALLLASRRRDAVFFVVSVAGVWLFNPVIKDLFQRPRPNLWPSATPASEFSFPSGHAANTAALAVALVLVLPAGRWRMRAFIVGAAAMIVVAFAQLALGMHYPSDILAGWLWAGAWVVCVWVVHSRRWRR